MHRVRSADSNWLHCLASASRAAPSSLRQVWISSLPARFAGPLCRQIGWKLRSGTLSTTAINNCPPTIIAGNSIIAELPCRERYQSERIIHRRRGGALPGPEQPGGPHQIDTADREDHQTGPSAEPMVGHALEHEG